jgi:PAS domain-containing protein
MAVRVVTYPRSDTVFAAFVGAEIAAGRPSIAEAESRIRRVYARAVLQERAPMAGYDVEPVWYVYRDGRPSGRDEEPWWTEPGTAEATFADGGVYRWANDEFCALHEVSPGGLIGRPWSDFATSESIAQADALWRHLMATGALARGEPIESTFTLKTSDGRLRPVEYRTAVEPDGTFRTWMRPAPDDSRTQ